MSWFRRKLMYEAETVKALKFTATGNSTLGFASHDTNPELEYSYDGRNWTVWSEGANAYADIAINDGKCVYVRGNNPNRFNTGSSNYTQFKMTGSLACEGNIMHLLSYENDIISLKGNYCFTRLFYGCTSLTAAPELPATNCLYSCYSYMFYGCTGLTSAPELPATALGDYCYNWMFGYCRNLTAAPALPATTLASGCYNSMFRQCTSLTSAPELPATALANSCYSYMFNSCKSLKLITMLATNISASNYLSNWVSGVSATGTFTKKAGVSIPSGVSGIPAGWNVIEVN